MAQTLDRDGNRSHSDDQRAEGPAEIITVNESPDTPNFVPQKSMATRGMRITFQAGHSIEFWVSLGGKRYPLFGGTQPYSAEPHPGNTLAIRDDAPLGAYVLSRNKPAGGYNSDPNDGEIRVGSGGGDGDART